LDWAVLDWNAPAIDVYRRIGAEARDDWRLRRLSGQALQDLAEQDRSPQDGAKPGRA